MRVEHWGQQLLLLCLLWTPMLSETSRNITLTNRTWTASVDGELYGENGGKYTVYCQNCTVICDKNHGCKLEFLCEVGECRLLCTVDIGCWHSEIFVIDEYAVDLMDVQCIGEWACESNEWSVQFDGYANGESERLNQIIVLCKGFQSCSNNLFWSVDFTNLTLDCYDQNSCDGQLFSLNHSHLLHRWPNDDGYSHTRNYLGPLMDSSVIIDNPSQSNKEDTLPVWYIGDGIYSNNITLMNIRSTMHCSEEEPALDNTVIVMWDPDSFALDCDTDADYGAGNSIIYHSHSPTQSPTIPPTSSHSGSNNSMNGGKVALMIVSVILLVVFVGGLMVILYYRKLEKHENQNELLKDDSEDNGEEEEIEVEIPTLRDRQVPVEEDSAE